MRLPFFFLLAFLFSIIIEPLASENHEIKLYESYKLGQMDVWDNVMIELERKYTLRSSQSVLYSLIKVQYGYIGYLIGANKKREARELLRKAEDGVEKLLQLNPQNADALALKAAFLAYHIGLSPYKAPFLGPRSMNMIDEALAINPNSVQALVEKGNSAHYAPAMFGGNAVKAIGYYSKAIGFMEENNGGGAPKTWFYLNALTQLALAQEKAGQMQNALRTYNRILSLAPDFMWVKEDLLPKLQGKF